MEPSQEHTVLDVEHSKDRHAYLLERLESRDAEIDRLKKQMAALQKIIQQPPSSDKSRSDPCSSVMNPVFEGGDDSDLPVPNIAGRWILSPYYCY